MTWGQKHDGNFVAYYRNDGRGSQSFADAIAEQKDQVRKYLNGGTWTLIGEFTEKEGSRKSFRPALDEAIELCLKKDATLIIARMDRLYRNAFFVSKLLDSKVKFVTCDNQHATNASIHVIAAIVEHDSEYFSKRTIEALKIAREKGRVFGSPTPSIGAEAAGIAVAQDADIFAARVWPAIDQARREGCVSYREIAARLTELGVATARGGAWHASTVRFVELRRNKK